jgi:hypothetical protein
MSHHEIVMRVLVGATAFFLVLAVLSTMANIARIRRERRERRK